MNEIMQQYGLFLTIHNSNPFIIYLCLFLILVCSLNRKFGFNLKFGEKVSAFLRYILAASLLLQMLLGVLLYVSRNLSFSLVTANDSLRYWIAIHPLLMGFGALLLLSSIVLNRNRTAANIIGSVGILSIIVAFILMPD